jgi:hypothetical protein
LLGCAIDGYDAISAARLWFVNRNASTGLLAYLLNFLTFGPDYSTGQLNLKKKLFLLRIKAFDCSLPLEKRQITIF